MKGILYTIGICLMLAACNKGSENTNKNTQKDWSVRYEVVSITTNPQLYIQWSNGVNTFYTGTTSNNAAWPTTPWTKDTVFKQSDGDRVIGLNVVYVMGNTPEQSITSRIYINGVKVKEVVGMNQFIKTGLK